MRALKLKREETSNGQVLRVEWDDRHTSIFPLSYLRDECPCAACKGENLFGTVYRPPALKMFQVGMYDLESLSPMGHYGVQAKWKDGHDTGIYSWDYLRMVCPCEECEKRFRTAPPETE
jgi:DUF971 family protein